VTAAPSGAVSVRLAFRAWLVDRSLVPQLRNAPELPESWKTWISEDPDRAVAFE
jgi:hypothetical protein